MLVPSIMIIYDMNNNVHYTKNAFAQIEPDSPKKQVELGVMPENIICKKEHVLAIRVNGAAMCVTVNTAEILADRGIIDRIIGHTAKYEDENAKKNTTSIELQDKINDMDTNQGNQTIVSNSTSAMANTNASATASNTDATNMANSTSAMANTNASATASNTDATNMANSTSAMANTNASATASNTDATNMANSTSAMANTNASATASNSQKDKSNPSSVTTIPASTMSVVNFYVTDHDLNIARNAPETISTKGLLEFTINGIPIEGPKTMTETGPNTGQFYVKLELPATINGRPLNQNDIVDITYLDKSDYSGEPHTVRKSFTLSSTYAQLQTQGDGGKRIGHEFRLVIHEPDANRDSQEEDRIPLNRFEFESKGNIKVTLDHHAFDANKSHMVETGPNTGIFDVTIKIPRQIDGKIINIGDWYKIIYNDYTTPSGTSEEIILRGKIGLSS